ncbi:MAG: carboxymuconolactone decarboxylase family protein [Firmicutes bacterium]|nr:carboxymuconolactone decarboxylase family protein [Bacillota bacterium]
MTEKLLVQPPNHMPFWVRLGTWFAERITGKEMLAPRILSWYKKAALSSGILEALVSHGEGKADGRLLKLIRIQISLQIGCPFCTDMNSSNSETHNITQQEIASLRDSGKLPDATFSPFEAAALAYARNLTATPPVIDDNVTDELRCLFNEKELVVISTTIAQVNYWARLLKGLGVPAACPIQNRK